MKSQKESTNNTETQKAANEKETTKGKRGRKPKQGTVKEEDKKTEPAPPKKEYQLYTLKFNSPILPFAKFPLTQNKYIQDFLRKYDEDKDKIQKVIGVHF